MAAELTRYAVSGWGKGELWTREGVVLAHELEFVAAAGSAGVEREREHANRRTRSAQPPSGLLGPPSGTVQRQRSRVGNGFVPKARRPASPRDALEPEALVGRFVAFLGGEDVRFDDVPLDLDGWTPFQHAVAAALRAVTRGEVVSYGELAALAGYPGAARAVGTFCARNRFMLLLPCHRVVGADGIGGYGSAGVGVKRRLLALEGVVV